jgi:hypothetical protein
MMLVALAGGCAARRPALTPSPQQQQTLASMRRLEKHLGFGESGNFRVASERVDAYYHCYYTGKFELPDSYGGLHLVDGTRDGCAVDDSRYDVFFYPMEAVAGAKTPVTTSLAEASPERFSVVVAHEDFHDVDEIRRLPTRFSEAAATLIGFLTAAEHAREEGAPEPLSLEAELYRRKSEIGNTHHGRLGRLYTDLRAGSISKAEAAAEKERLFRELKTACEAITPVPTSFNPCPGALNNAGLAFDATYTRFYPLLYRLYAVLGSDLRATIQTLRNAPRGSEPDLVRYFEGLVNVMDQGAIPATPAVTPPTD